jgi:hypothetical protein
MINRKGFTVVQLLVSGILAGLVLIFAIAAPNALRQTRNSSRAQDTHVLGLLIKEQQTTSSTASLPDSCNNTQRSCFSRGAKLSFYDNTSLEDTTVTYYRNAKPYSELSPRLELSDPRITDKVIVHSYAVCHDQKPTGEGASAGNIIIQYATESFRGKKLVCKQIY